MKIDKEKIRSLLIEVLESKLRVLTSAATAAHQAAIHPESQAEDKYDTRGLEASYLAGAQSKRAMELQETLTMLKHLGLKSFASTDPITATALIELHDGEVSSFYMLLPLGGGLQIELDKRTISVVTPQSPLGQALLTQTTGECIEIQIQGKKTEYEICNIY